MAQAYSQDAYLRGNEPYTGEAQNLPEPHSVSYSSSKPTSATQSHGLPDNLNSGIVVGSQSAHQHLTHQRTHSSSSAGITTSPLDFHFANHNAAIVSASLPHPSKGSFPQARSELCHQALSDWYYSQADRPGLGMSHHHRCISQDRVCELGLLLGRSYSGWPQSTSQDTILLHYSAAMGANHSPCTDSYGLGRWGQTSSQSFSENLLAAYASYEQSYDLSLETLEKASVLITPHYERPAWPHQSSQPISNEEHPSLTNQHVIVSATMPPSAQGLNNDHQPAAQIKSSLAQTADDQTVGYRSYSPSFCQKSSHRMQHSHSFRDPSYTRPQHIWCPTPKTSPLQSASFVTPPTAEPQDSARAGSVVSEFAEEPIQIQEVVFRQKPPSGRKAPHGVQHPHYALPVISSEPHSATVVSSWSENSVHQTNGGIPPLPVEQDSLTAIPFIGNLKNSRRSSYMLAIITERSMSCDEGLNTFKEESRVFSRLPKRVKSFFTDGSLESLRAAEEAHFKRHSNSELGNITVTDIRKEGWLHYKQILTEKGKKVGSGMRPWKRVFCVLRSRSLVLYKDKREAVLHAGHGNWQGEDEQPISIRGCLIDIAYSETKRKHTLRLTTQDFCEYLLQAEDRDDMLSWIRVIRENSKTDNGELGFSRQALINKKLNDYRKQSPTGNKPETSPRVHRMLSPFLLSKTENTSGVNRAPGKDDSTKAPWGINIMKKGKKTGPKSFGERLEDCLPAANNKFVPQIVVTCCRLVEEMGLEYTGIYRVPGNNAMVSSLQDLLNKGMDIDTAEERWKDLNVISSLLKSFFRKLPEPLFTDDKYNDFIDANRLEDAGDRLKAMRKLILDLPDHYYHTLKFLISHLKTVADHSEKNKMEPRNLALVFGPTLVRTSEDSMTDMVTHMPDRYKITETLILHHMWFFSDEQEKDEKTPEDQQNIQPVPNIDHLLSNIGRTVLLRDSLDFTTRDSAKSKGTSTSKKDLSAKDFLPLSISAVTRKRKKHPNTFPEGSSTDEVSEHEPIKASNYEEMSGNSEVQGDSEARQSRRPPRKSEEETEEVSEMEGKPKQVEEGQEEERVTEKENDVILQKEHDEIKVKVSEREQTGQIRSRRSPSFLYSHHHSVSRLGASLKLTNASASICFNPPQPLNITRSLTRRKLREERVRPHSLYVEQDQTGEERASHTYLDFSRVKASLVRGQEKLRQAVLPGWSSRESSLQQVWMCQEQVNRTADCLWGAGSREQAASGLNGDTPLETRLEAPHSSS